MADKSRTNGYKHLAQLDENTRRNIINLHTENGVSIPCADGVMITPDCEIAPGTLILPGTVIYGGTKIGEGCVIGPNSMLEGCLVGEDSIINSVHF